MITRFDKLRTELPHLDEEPQLTAPVGPDIDPDMFAEVAGKPFPAVAPKRRTASTSKSRR